MRAAVVALTLAAAVAGCGGDEVASAPGPQLVVDADPGGALKFTERELTASAGSVTLAMHNPSSVVHDVALKGAGVDVRGKLVGEGKTSTVTADLEPGDYTFYCSVPGHADAGMSGMLRVRSGQGAWTRTRSSMI
jgi:uncharacterized cupredoxin-like copper-binding protein